MGKSVQITTPRPTFEELTRRLRIPKARQKELDAMAEEAARQILKAREETTAKSRGKQKVKVKDAAAA